MPEVTLNYWAILAGAASNMAIGYIWYSKALFAKSWMQLIGKQESDLKQKAGPAMGFMVLLALLTAYVLAHFVDYTQATTFTDGMVTGLWVWLGFTFTAMVAGNMFEGRPMKLTAINVGYQLVALVAMGGIVAAWK